MRIVVLGSTGMLGHKMVERLEDHHKVSGLSRKNFDGTDKVSVWNALNRFKPQVVINCVGIVKQRPQDIKESILINSLLPLELVNYCRLLGAGLIHFSTDCVFSGKYGSYKETSKPDPEDTYGQTKLLGEVKGENVLTIRTSIVGREKDNYRGLLEWFLKQKGDVQGYSRSIFSGVTTNWLADTVLKLLEKDLSGLYHVASHPISKFRLLQLFKEIYDRDVNVIKDSGVFCDRSLDGSKFEKETGIKTPDWKKMLIEQRDQDKGKYAI